MWIPVVIAMLLLLLAAAFFALRRRRAWARRRQYALRNFPLPPPGGVLGRASVPKGLDRAPTMKGPREEARGGEHVDGSNKHSVVEPRL